MTWTWAEIMSLALVRSGLLGRGQIASASLQTDAIKATGLLLDEWDGLGLSLPDISYAIAFNTVATQAKYLLGPAGSTPAYAVRPREVITATLTLVASQVLRVGITPMSFESYTLIPIPSTTSQPFHYAINVTWPQMEFYLYPTPDKVYPITLNCKLKWSDTITTPDINPFVIATVPEGYATALLDNLSLKLAEIYRLDTTVLQTKATNSRFTLAQNVMTQYRKQGDYAGIGAFSDVIIRSGVNP